MMLAVSGLTAAACGGGDDEPTGDNGEATATAEPTREGDDDGEASPTEEADEDGADIFRERAGDNASVSGKVTYTFSSTGAPDSIMTRYVKDDLSRLDITDDGGNVTTIIDTADASYLCSDNQCFDDPALTGGLAAAFLGFYDPGAISEAAADAANVDGFDEEIAGEDAKCFSIGGGTIAGQAAAGKVTWCFADDGLLLRATFEGGGAVSGLEATEVSRDVSDDDFEPLFDVVEIPGFPTP